MNLKKKYRNMPFEEAVKEFNFNQFYEVCKIFGVDVVDRTVWNQLAAEAKENGTEIDLTKVKMRRDFDKMTEELVENYKALPRRNRRQIDPIIAKIIWGNRQAKHITENKIKEQYNEGLEILENLNDGAAIELDSEVKVENVIEENSTEGIDTLQEVEQKIYNELGISKELLAAKAKGDE